MGDAVEQVPQTFPQQLAHLLWGLLAAVASGDCSRDNNHHSKPTVAWNHEDVFAPPLFQDLRRFSSLFRNPDIGSLQIKLVLGLVKISRYPLSTITLSRHTDRQEDMPDGSEHRGPLDQISWASIFPGPVI